MVVIDTHLARGASNGSATFHNQGGPYGRTNGNKRIVCVDVTGLPLCVRVVPASTSEASAVEQMLDDLARTGSDERLAGLPEMMGTREWWIVPLNRENGCGSANRSCYYVDL